MTFQGIPEGKIKFNRLPRAFFTELLPQIDHLGELKVTLYVLWRLDSMEDDVRFLKDSDFLEDSLFISGLAESRNEAEKVLADSLLRCLDRGTLLKATIETTGEEISLYFFNSPKGRTAVEAIQNGMWRPDIEKTRIAIELVQEQPNIFQLYEDNIGPVTPLLAEALSDAENEYPANWIEEAFRIAVEKNVRNWRYVEAILRRWQERGYDAREYRRDTEKTRQKYADWED